MRKELNIEPVSKLIVKIRDGLHGENIKSVGFSSSYEWDKDRIVDLWNATINNFDLGPIVLWMPPTELAAETNLMLDDSLGPMVTGALTGHSLILLSGAHRLASLLWGSVNPDNVTAPLNNISQQERDIFLGDELLCADTETRKIGFYPKSSAYTSTRLPVYEIQDRGFLSRGIRKIDEGKGIKVADEAIDWFGRVVSSPNATATVTTLIRATPEDLLENVRTLHRMGVAGTGGNNFKLAENLATLLSITNDAPRP